MTETQPVHFKGHRSPAEIIGHAVWLYYRFPLSLRMVEDMLAYRGVVVTHKTVREWAEKFGRAYAVPFAVAHLALVINGTWMRLLLRSRESAISCGERLIRMALCSTFWFKSAAIPRLPSASCENF